MESGTVKVLEKVLYKCCLFTIDEMDTLQPAGKKQVTNHFLSVKQAFRSLVLFH